MSTVSGTINVMDGQVTNIGVALLDTETVITLYAANANGGSHERHEVGLEVSPNPSGTGPFFKLPGAVKPGGPPLTHTVAAAYVRTCVPKPENSASDVVATILAK